MTQFYSTINKSKKKEKNSRAIFYKYAYFNITVSSYDNSSYSLIITLVLVLLSEAGSDSLIRKVKEAHKVTANFKYLGYLMAYFKYRDCCRNSFEGGADTHSMLKSFLNNKK